MFDCVAKHVKVFILLFNSGKLYYVNLDYYNYSYYNYIEGQNKFFCSVYIYYVNYNFPLFLLKTIYLIFSVALGSFSSKYGTYNSIKSDSLSMLNVGINMKAPSLLSCSVACMSYEFLCFGFSFNKTTGDCALGKNYRIELFIYEKLLITLY